MTVSVLVVDDSAFFRKRLTEILGSAGNIKVVGAAANGREAVDMALRLRPDVITMDYEMPIMDGISALREIMSRQPTPVLMFSSLTYEGARVTLDALDAGAVDYLPKNFEAIARNASDLQNILKQRILEVARSRVGGPATRRQPGPIETPVPSGRPQTQTPRPAFRAGPGPTGGRGDAATAETLRPKRKTPPRHYSVVAIGTSTGGPVALQQVLTRLPADFPAPIVLVQHMPASFTPAFADRLNKLCRIGVRQAVDGESLVPGVALLAPGGEQMMLESRGQFGRIRIHPGDSRLNYRPCVDVTFGSLARQFPGKTLGIILTGMGADGREGCRMMKQTGSVVWAQDERTSVIYGMPMAVAKAGLADEILALDEVATRLVEGVV